MGIHDRDYYRNTGGPRFIRRARRVSVINWLIGLNLGVWILQMLGAAMFGEQAVAYWLYLQPELLVKKFHIWKLLTAAFCHSTQSLWHILWNMLFLWWFGRELEQIYGSRNLLVFYLAAAVLANVIYVIGTYWHTPDAVRISELGASGAVMGVVVLFAFLFPYRQVYVWFLFPVPIWMVAVLFVASDLFGFVHQQSGVANAAHLGGALAGVIYKYFDLRIERFTRARRLRRQRRAEVIPFPRQRPAAADPEPSEEPPELAARKARVEELLAKISREGFSSLSEEEQDFLKNMSPHYRQR